jgi:hypothetical protein
VAWTAVSSSTISIFAKTRFSGSRWNQVNGRL